MYDIEILMDSLRKIRKALETIIERASVVDDPNEFLCSPGGMLRLDAICMNLIALGEAVKALDTITATKLATSEMPRERTVKIINYDLLVDFIKYMATFTENKIAE